MTDTLPSVANDPPPAPLPIDMEHFFAMSLDLMCVAGFDGYFRRVNPSWTRVLGWSEAELLSRPVHDFMHPQDREITLRAREDLARGIPVRGLENRYLCKDGSHRWLAWKSVTDPTGRLVFAVARDITERRQAEQERLVRSKLESTGVLAGGIAHDFNNLLASLVLNLDLVEIYGTVTEEQARFLREARQSVQSAAALTQQLITFSEAGPATRRISHIGQLLLQTSEITLQDSGLHVDRVIAADLAPADVDETQIAQVFRGLLQNAREATLPGGHLRIHAENVHVSTNALHIPVGHYLRILIGDDGAGIPAVMLDQIFDPYFSSKRRCAQKGMGLSLAICRTIVQRHGGSLTIESEHGRGTAVICLLPASIPPSPVAQD